MAVNRSIHTDPEILGGTPVFTGTRVPAKTLIDYLAGGHSLDGFLDDFPSVTREQALAALGEAGKALNSRAHSSRRTSLWQQFGGAIDMLENAIVACPDALWSDRSQRPEFWYVAYHTLFFLDLYLSESLDGFTPPAPFTLDELDDAGILPERPYRKDELLPYLEHGREKCRAVIGGLTEETMQEVHAWWTRELSVLEMLMYNLRHVQHHAAQLNLILRQQTDSAPAWVARTKHPLDTTEPPA
jgi:uncharacterized protein (DUF433 family)